MIELNALPPCPGVDNEARWRMTQSFSALGPVSPGQAFDALMAAHGGAGSAASPMIKARLDLQLGALMQDSAAELSGRQISHHIAAASLLSKLLGGNAAEHLAAYGAGMTVARALQQDFEYNTDDKKSWARSWQQLQSNGHTDALRSVTELALVPQRARAFDLLPREQALSQFPELGGAYGALDVLRSIQPNTPGGQKVFEQGRDQVLSSMRRGFLHPTHRHLAAITIQKSLTQYRLPPAVAPVVAPSPVVAPAVKTPATKTRTQRR